MSPPASTVVAVAGLELFKLVLKDVYTLAKDAPGAAKTIWTAKYNSSRLYAKISAVKKVHTLLHLDKAVDLRSFYQPLHVAEEKKRFTVSVYDDFQTGKNVLIGGVAGQGKSIFLRHLCLSELDAGKRLPLFIELRYISKKKSISDQLKDQFEHLGLQYSEGVFKRLADAGKLILLLDAFDEIPESERPSAALAIDALASKYPELPIIVTSRPGTELYQSTHFDKYRLSDLEGDEFQQVIYRLISDASIAKNLIHRVGKHRGQIGGLLKTPLLVTLLVVTYRSFQEVPAQMAGFYEDLFQLLLQRHDGMKLKYARARSCPMNDAEYRRVFEAFCFFSKALGKSVFTVDESTLVAERALKECSVRAEAIKFVTDIVKITCLVLKDGNEYRFIHKSVQEFYAASFLRRTSDVVASEFYLTTKDQLFYRSPWSAELRFLSEIDEYRYLKFYVLAGSAHIFGLIGVDLAKVTGEQIRLGAEARIMNLSIHPMRDNSGKLHDGFTVAVPAFGVFSERFWGSSIGEPVQKALLSLTWDKLTPFLTAGADGQHPATITIAKLAEAVGSADQIKAGIVKWADEVAAKLRASQTIVNDRDNFARLNDVFSVKGPADSYFP